MVLDILISIFSEFIKEPIMEFVVVPIKRHISYPFTYKSNVKKLHDESGKLKNRTVELQQAVEEATRKGEEIYERVNKWLNDAGKAIEEAEECIKGEEQAKKRCFVGLCPDLKTRYQLSKKTEKKTLAIHELANKGDHNPISFRPPLQQIVAPSVYAREGLNSRMLFLEKVMDALLDPDLNMIGVYGLGGVGKTTLAKQVHRKALEGKRFGVVAMVAVGQTPELRRIQSEIADILGLEFKVEEIPGRANRLYERLKKELEKEKTELEKEKKVLIILDDIWKQLDLNAVGIPFGDDFKGCKIFLTSRSQDVLSREMGTQKEFRLDVLQDEEARSLFEITVAIAKDSEFQPIAAEIAKKCAGLPFLLCTVATDLKNRGLYAWKYKLKQLSEFNNEEIYLKVRAILESTYNNLCSNEIKSFFLLCGLLGQSNIEIQSLLKYIMGLSLFKSITVEDARDKLRVWIDTLKAQSLLQDGDMCGFIKIHDVVRETALSIASREQHAFIVTSGKEFVKFPNKDCTRISLQYCDIENLPEGWECPKAEALFLFTDVFCLGIPDQFFKGIRNLEVVDFTGIHFVSLPSSLAFLSNLHTLCLHRCQLDDLAIIGDLKQLRVLSFANSYIVELPRQIEQLARLKVLDVSNCSKLKMIPANALSKLSELEELYMSNSFVEWEADGNNASLAELEKLSQLTTSEMQILDDKILPKHLFSNGRLQSFRILIGDNWDWDDSYKTSRLLKLKLKTSIHSGYEVKVLLRETEDLFLDEVGEAENLLYDINGDGFPKLKHLRVQNNHAIQHIIKWAACDAFPILESLILENLMKLEKIYHGGLTEGSFNKLKILRVKNCQKLTHLFSLSAVKCLLQLQEMEVEDCPEMKAIVIDESQNSNEVFEFNDLRSLNLQNLPNLRTFHNPSKIEEFMSGRENDTHLSFFSRTVSFPNLEHLELVSVNCEKIWHDQLSTTSSKLETLTVKDCNELKHLFTTSIVKRLLQLETLHISSCTSMEEIILTEKFIEDEDEMMNQILFPKLDELTLCYLPKLIRFCTGYQIEFQSLRDLDIDSTGMMEKQDHIEMNQNQNQNQNAEIQSLFNGMVGFPNLERLSLSNINELKRIWHSPLAANSFFKLKSLDVSYCQKLMAVFPSNDLERFRRMEELCVSNCASLQEIYQLEGFNVDEAFELRRLNISGLGSLKHVWRKDPQGVFSFQNLKSVKVSNCDILNYLFPTSIAEGLLQLEELTITCCGVVEIIAKVEDVEQDPYCCFKFPQLTSLQLIDLSKLRSWYPETHNFECQKLTSLDVRNCHKIIKFSFQETHEEGKQSLLFLKKMSPNLEELTLEHKDLIVIQQGQFFSKLKMLTLTNLQNKSRPFIIGFLQRLSSVETIFVQGHNTSEELFSYEGLAGEEEEEHARTLARVKNLKLESVDNLKHIWDPYSRLKPLLQYLETLSVFGCESLINVAPSSSSFQNLATLEVIFCEGLANLITASTAKSMVHLTKMTVQYCDMMTEIVTSDGDDHTEDEIINFDKLKCLELYGLPGLISFCSGNNAFNFPALENVTVNGCSRMKIFAFGDLKTPKLRGIVLEYQQRWGGNLNATLAEMMSPNLEKLTLEHKDLIEIQQGQFFSKLKMLTLTNLQNKSRPFIIGFLERLYSVETILVQGHNTSEELFSYEGLAAEEEEHPARVKNLKLESVDNLKHIWDPDSGLKPLLQYLETLSVIGCRSLINVAPSSSSFQNLATLEVRFCAGLANLITESTAKSMVQLTKMTVQRCNMMTEIVTSDGDDHTEDEIINFDKLKFLELYGLPGLISFCSGNNAFNFPALENVTVNRCSRMKIFASGLLNTPKLRGIRLGDQRHWEGNLNATLAEMPFCQYFKASEFPELWHDGMQGRLLRNVKRLEVDKCAMYNKAIPSNVLVFLNKLKELEVKDCDSADVVFDLEGVSADDGLLPRLKKLELTSLPMLRHLWNKDPIGILEFKNLKWLHVGNCSSLKYIFTWSMALCLLQLEKIELNNCKMIEGIIEKEETEEAVNSADKMILHSLKSVVLKCLPRFSRLCSGWSNVECPLLEEMSIHECPSLKYIFTWSMALCLLQLEKIELNNCKMIEGIIEKEETEEAVNSADKMILHSLKSVVLKCLPRFSRLCSGWSNVECPLLEEMSIHKCPSLKNIFATQTLVNTINKMFPNLEKFSLDKKSTITILGFQFPTGFFSKVKVLELSFFLNKYHVPLFSLLPIFPNLERFEVLDSSLNELLPFEGLGGVQEDITTIPQIRDLKLKNLPDLKHIWNPDGQLHDPLFQSLETFEINSCGNLIVLAPSSVSLGNLKTLKVFGCKTLANIFTSAAAKSMVQLETLNVRFCNMLTEIIGGVEEDGSTDEIVFSKMKTLELEILPNLTGFCLGSYIFNFPSLEQVTVYRCPKLRIFTVRQLSASKIHGVFTGRRFNRTFHWEGDLNATIEQIYMKYIGFREIYGIQLSNFPMLKEKWHGQFPFENLRHIWRLVVDECAFFSNAISSNLLKHLSYLNELAVERCDSVEDLFDLEGLNDDEDNDGLLKSLKELRLIDLPRLRHVWNKDPQGILSFRNLTLLKVENCSSLTNIFTLSMALGLVKLKHLELKRCNLVEHIITKEAEEEIAKDNTIFPSMESMSLECLPNLSSFYSARDVLKCPSLKRIEIVGCPNMELLASKFCKEHDLSMIAEGNGERIAASSGGKVVIPSLEELRVEYNTIKNLCSQTSQADFLCGLKGIELTCISSDFTLLPSQFFKSLPILEKLVLSDASVMECGRLQVLVASSVSFQNLTALQVSNCQGLVNLLSSSTARSLERLEKMKIEECELIQEVIVAKVDEEEENEICFSRLKCLELQRLPSLSSFCSGNLTFSFPSMEEVIIVECPNMKIFAQEVSTPQLWRVQTGERKYEWEWEGSLNNTIQALFKEKKAEETGIGQCSCG
ncbi:hypothetical protein MANES_07G062324v8 [Manihot esculenta]|uniref:Uncharacterized protein n=1 Tax=Manihot esculenta TaxID=3983 RepID=A0ACB7HF88_MANES|nr:hypothetical protein MANES_07G062324v8 [Manihot esculenta]